MFHTDQETTFDCTIKFFDNPDKYLEVESKFDQGFVDELKRTIPGNFRVWDSIKKVWNVAPKYRQIVKEIALNYYKSIEVVKG